ncbi:DNA repair protein RAD16 [Verticillium dahliae VdLs.17]|uniref:DNA repair protein RAD16 n=1 Tax=Verticillium dahliae (strain VdLs.17 / ATCC MYA-4575 / FGSC 10137) TaxID=498257 RepID=G2WQ91_VERDV|nr:DNA repair protein RAD16 [Verticillium dahliae VdLs.17]EGY13851.1 DNA repair protein RAD16 [Verticillium dahliae VdLs.17]
MSVPKRSHDVIDLTDDADEGGGRNETFSGAPQRKRHAPSSHPSQSSPSRGRKPSSQPSLSQRHNATSTSQSSWSPQVSQHWAPQNGRVYASSSQPIADDVEVIDLTQSNDEPPMEFYGSLPTKVVGVRYYAGNASAGEIVLCNREPHNQYDSNALQVTNVLGDQIGHIPRNVAAKLAPYLDRGEIILECQLSGEMNFYDCPIRLRVYGPSDRAARRALEDRLKKDRIFKAAELSSSRAEAEARRDGQARGEGFRGAGTETNAHLKARADAAELRMQQALNATKYEPPEGATMVDLVATSETIDVRKGADAIKTMTEEQMAAMPMADEPAFLVSKLLPYQLQGLHWMLAQEDPQLPKKDSSDSVQLWRWHQNKRGMVNMATKFSVAGEAKLLSGGILADDMGLGKTLQVISLILSGTGSGPTLIVAPVSVMSNWQQQFDAHVRKDKAPKIHIHHGSAASEELSGYDIVITSYGKLAKERLETTDSARGPLMSVDWRRVVLDEGHIIRNAKTQAARAACQLKAASRWVLTGTPIVNNLQDLQSMLSFLHMTGGVEQPTIFNTVITRPLTWGHKRAEALLQNIMHDLCLRRRKDMAFVDLKLPPKTEYVHRITFRSDESEKYKVLLQEAQGVLQEYQSQARTGRVPFQSVLEKLLRLRQTCNHWTLCRARIDDLLKVLEGQDVVVLNDKNKAVLQQALRLFIETQEDCPICFDTLSEPVITHCKHVYCRRCITKVIELQRKCPMCRQPLGVDSLLEPAPEEGQDDDANAFDGETQSSKTEALLKIVQATCKDPQSKVVIFSQWTSFLNIIQTQIEEAGLKWTRIDGSMKPDKRDAAIAALVGLNLVAADTVILADSWWAPAIEDQAVDRVHRLGQKRPTTVWRLVMENTIEEQVLEIQAAKRQLISKAFQEKSREKKTKETRMADIVKLLGWPS